MTDHIGSFVILGADGDLASRLLLPGLGQLLEQSPRPGLQLIGVGRSELGAAAWQERVRDSFAAAHATGAAARKVAEASRFLTLDVTKPENLRRILAECSAVPALYFALPPAVTIATCEALAAVELPEGTEFGMEKPFGTDLTSAVALNRTVVKLLPERSIHRIDHFLAKSTVLNLLGLRFANRVFEQIWDAENIDTVEITFDEQLALEGRAGYYDRAGALVDMIQSHLLLVLALVVMEPPSSLHPDDLRGAMAQALRATRVWQGDPRNSRRARYTTGTIAGKRLPSYVDEPGVSAQRHTETLAEVTLGVENWRWSGVRFILRSGKALAGMRKEIVVTFKDVPHLPTGFTGIAGRSRLSIGLGPERIGLDLRINGEGDPFKLDRISLAASFAAGELGPYGEVLSGILKDDPTLSVRADEVEECWRIVSPVLAAWQAGALPLEEYAAGSTGPSAWVSAD